MKIGSLFLLLIAGFIPLHAQDSGAIPAGAPKGWPRSFTNNGTAFTVYQPQAISWSNGILTFRAAASVLPEGTAQPTFGTVTLCGMTAVDNEQQTVALSNIATVQATFPSATDQARNYGIQIENKAARWGANISLQAINASLAVTTAEGNSSKPVQVQNTPPTIYFSQSPALLVLVDGDPALRAVQGSSLLRVINTQALIVLDQSSGTYYLRVNGGWVQAQKITGPWTVASNPPATLAPLLQQAVASGNVQLYEPPSPQGSASPISPAIFVSTTPAELITTQGPPAFEPVSGTQLLHATNTASSLFMNLADQTYYVLISGRWFSSSSLSAACAWQFVPANQLPGDFATIPENAPAGAVLASVAGTPQAAEAAIASTIPQTAMISRTASTNVIYDGNPQFEKISGTDLSYAKNTATPVIQVSQNKYFSVVNGVWFKSSSPSGPWRVAAKIPSSIYTIPPSCPIYYVTNVFVYNSTPDAVYVGYTPGYFGTCLAPDGVVVFGTGYYYPPYIGPNLWIGAPLTYGFGAGVACGLASGFAFGLAVDHGWGYSPWWGAWHGGWGGGNSVNWNNVNVNHLNTYNHWGNNVLRNGSLSQSQINNAKSTARSDYNQAEQNYNANHPNAASKASTWQSNHPDAADHLSSPDRTALRNDSSHLGENNVFAGNDGRPYRSSDNGSWQQNDKSGWSDADHSSINEQTRSDLDSQRYARNVGSYRASGFSGGGRDFGGGGFRGGGFRR